MAQLRLARRAVESAEPSLFELAIGGTAVGTGLDAHARLGPEVAQRLASETGLPFASAPDKFAALAGHEPMTALMGGLGTLAGALLKIANDVWWLASGPRYNLPPTDQRRSVAKSFPSKASTRIASSRASCANAS